MTTDGNPPIVRGVNSLGLRRAGFTDEERRALKNAYRVLFRSELPIKAALTELEQTADKNVRHLVRFIRESKRGITSRRRQRDIED